MRNRLTNLLALLLLVILAGSALISMGRDALTFDELAHIPAGYTYLADRDYRVNPEHPPIVKDLSAIPLLLMDVNFPYESENWQQSSPPEWFVQFHLGSEFIYNSGNNPHQMIFWSRVPMVLLLLLLALVTFWWARKLGGPIVGLVALALVSFSPTLIAHGRLVTTDIGAALGVIVGLYFWVEFLKRPRARTVCAAGLAFGFALLLKFSTVMLIPVVAVLTFVWAYLVRDTYGGYFKSTARFVSLAALAGIIGVVVVVWPVYVHHTSNYPMERQVRDTAADLAPHPSPALRDATVWMANQPLLRPLAQYQRGVLMAMQRSSFGNTTFWRGDISVVSWRSYFPVLYMVKEPIALHVGTLGILLGVLLLALRAARRTKGFHGMRKKVEQWGRDNIAVVGMLGFIVLYWYTAIEGNLNIGVRHLIPTYPLVFILLALGGSALLRSIQKSGARYALAAVFAALLVSYGASSVLAFPHYLSYYNAVGGGSEDGHRIAVDSNYDWGQDFHRLRTFVHNNAITELHLDYFGGEDPAFWLGDIYVPLMPREVDPDNPPRGWIAVSVNELVSGTARPVKGFDQATGFYEWLDVYEPVARAGHSIFIYYIE